MADPLTILSLVSLATLTAVYAYSQLKEKEGQLIFLDNDDNPRTFRNYAFYVTGRPDAMYQTKTGIIAEEYKSRNGPIYKSDVLQAKCAALPARGEGYRVTEILVRTNNTSQRYRLPNDDRALYSEIREYIELARRAKSGDSVPAKPSQNKCRGCAYGQACKYAER